MSERTNARDTQFQGFAHALLLQLAEENALALNWERFFGELELTVARRVYDLACHLLKNGDPVDLDTGGEYSAMEDEEAQRRVNNLPDMTELPKEIDEKEIARQKEISEILSHADELDVWELHEKLCNVGLSKEQECEH